MLYLAIQKWADFDVPYDDVILFSNCYSKKDKDDLIREFIQEQKLDGCSYDDGQIGNLQYVKKDNLNFSYGSDLNELADRFISFLKKKGFKGLRTEGVSFCD